MNISIRQFEKGDEFAFYDAIQESTKHLSQWLPWCTPQYSISDAKQWVYSAVSAWKTGTNFRFIIENSDTQLILGAAGINQVVHQHKVGNLGYWVRSSALNKGVCTKAARMVIEYAFNELSFQRIEIHVAEENRASNAVASKLGGIFEGTFRNKLRLHNQPIAAKCYSVIPSDYDCRKN